MTLYREIAATGERIPLTPDEELTIRAEWAANERSARVDDHRASAEERIQAKIRRDAAAALAKTETDPAVRAVLLDVARGTLEVQP